MQKNAKTFFSLETFESRFYSLQYVIEKPTSKKTNIKKDKDLKRRIIA
jgi:hypothetical protein